MSINISRNSEPIEDSGWALRQLTPKNGQPKYIATFYESGTDLIYSATANDPLTAKKEVQDHLDKECIDWRV